MISAAHGKNKGNGPESSVVPGELEAVCDGPLVALAPSDSDPHPRCIPFRAW